MPPIGAWDQRSFIRAWDLWPFIRAWDRWPLIRAWDQSSQRALQRAQPWLEATPLVETLFEDRPAHLFRARRAHAALGLVVLETRRLEVEAAEIEYAPHVPLEGVHHILVLDAQHSAGKHCIPVPHEPLVDRIVAGDVFDAVGEFLTGSEELLEIREAASHRLAPRVDDPSIRKHQVNEADVAKIIRHLVDEARFSAAIHAGIGDVFLAVAAGIFGAEIREDLRIARVRSVRLAALQLAHQPKYVGQLRGA